MQNRPTGGSARGNVYWGRADRDGAPFRGAAPPTASEEELEDRLQKVADPHNRMFDLNNPEDNKAYLEVMDMWANGWANVVHRKHYGIRVRRVHVDPETQVKTITRDVHMKVYVEWVQFYMEDGMPMMSQRPMIGRTNDDA